MNPEGGLMLGDFAKHILFLCGSNALQMPDVKCILHVEKKIEGETLKFPISSYRFQTQKPSANLFLYITDLHSPIHLHGANLA
jgi:hypothetical protein